MKAASPVSPYASAGAKRFSSRLKKQPSELDMAAANSAPAAHGWSPVRAAAPVVHTTAAGNVLIAVLVLALMAVTYRLGVAEGRVEVRSTLAGELDAAALAAAAPGAPRYKASRDGVISRDDRHGRRLATNVTAMHNFSRPTPDANGCVCPSSSRCCVVVPDDHASGLLAFTAVALVVMVGMMCFAWRRMVWAPKDEAIQMTQTATATLSRADEDEDAAAEGAGLVAASDDGDLENGAI